MLSQHIPLADGDYTTVKETSMDRKGVIFYSDLKHPSAAKVTFRQPKEITSY